MRNFPSLLFIPICYIIFLLAESITRYKLNNFFNRDYLHNEMFRFIPYLFSYVFLLWIILITFIVWMFYTKDKSDKENNTFKTWIIIFGFVAVPLSILISPFFRIFI